MSYEYTCVCPARHLLEKGCTCGAVAAEKSDALARANVEAYERRQEMLRQRDFLIKPPTPDITFKTLCSECQHEFNWGKHTEHNQCSVKDCLCGVVKP